MASDRPIESAMPEQSQRQGNSGKLNVILHGLFAFDQEEDEIVAHIPNMGSEHLYKAGNWLAETNLEEHADLKLTGVKPTQLQPRDVLNEPPAIVKKDGDTVKGYKLDPNQNIILGNVIVSSNARECHCIHATIRLPYPPSRIQSLRRLKLEAAALGGDDKNKVVQGNSAVESATVQVLTYDFENDADLRLGNHPWEPVLAGGYVNLHIFSEPERSPEEDHLRHAFQASVGLFVGVDLTVKGRARPADPDGTIDGLHEFELQDLVQRKRWLNLLGRAIKEGRDLNVIWEDPTPFSGSDACTGCAASDS